MILYTLQMPYNLINIPINDKCLQMAQTGLQKSMWLHQINTFHSRLKHEGWIINQHICCWVPLLPTSCLYGLNHFCLFTISLVAMFVCISELKNLVILLPAPRQEPKGFNILSSHSKNSLKQCWALDCVHSGHLQAAAHQELRLTGLEAWWQSCVMLAAE